MIRKIVVLFIFMLLVGTVLPVSGNFSKEINYMPFSSDNILYVGGTGPNNYTKIQDAIDDAKEGDNVFVYDDSSPYFESLNIYKSIQLHGENKETTIIDATMKGSVLNISADSVTVSGFTLKNSSKGWHAGVMILSEHNTIKDNIINKNPNCGIILDYEFKIYDFSDQGFNLISENIISNSGNMGVFIVGCNNNLIGNTISKIDGFAVALMGSYNSNLSGNTLTDNNCGIFMYESYNNIVYKNTIMNSAVMGLDIFSTSSCKYIKNNFINNYKNVYYVEPILDRILFIKLVEKYPIRRSEWEGNYWGKPRSIPYLIPGWFNLWFDIHWRNPFHIQGNSFQIDWNPAKEPYDIGI